MKQKEIDDKDNTHLINNFPQIIWILLLLFFVQSAKGTARGVKHITKGSPGSCLGKIGTLAAHLGLKQTALPRIKTEIKNLCC